MKNKTNTENKIVEAMRISKGRFFSVGTKSGQVINAQFVYETPKTVVIYDRNNDTHLRLNKTSLAKFGMGAVQIS
jgi:hypothetical protein